MDDRRFDEISKHLSTGLSRKGILRLLGGLGVAGVTAAGALLPAEAKKKRKRKNHDKGKDRDNHKRDNDHKNEAAAQPAQAEARKAKGKRKGKGKKRGKNKQQPQQGGTQSQPQSRVSLQAETGCGSGKALICHKSGQSGAYQVNCVDDSSVCGSGHAGHAGDCICQSTAVTCPGGQGTLPACESGENVACGLKNGSPTCTGCATGATACGPNCCTSSQTCCNGTCVDTSTLCGGTCDNLCNDPGTCETGPGQCVNGRCQYPAVVCDDPGVCDVPDSGVCNAQTGQCEYTPITCDTPGTCETGPGQCVNGTCQYPPLCAEDETCCGETCCVDPEICTEGTCCTPDTCEGTYAGQCGTFPQGCGLPDVTCECAEGETCNPGGVCVVIPGCTPIPIEQACAGLQCGPASNGCGVDYECGLCPTKKKKGQRARKQTCVSGVCKPFKKKRCIGSGLAGQPCSGKCKCANGRKCDNGRCCEGRGDGTVHCTANNDCCPGLMCAYRRPGQHRVCMPKNAKGLFTESTEATATPGLALGAVLTGLAATLGTKLTGNGEPASVAMDEVQIHALGPRD